MLKVRSFCISISGSFQIVTVINVLSMYVKLIPSYSLPQRALCVHNNHINGKLCNQIQMKHKQGYITQIVTASIFDCGGGDEYMMNNKTFIREREKVAGASVNSAGEIG